MGLNYSIAMLKNPQNQDESAKAYAKSQITGELSLKELSRRVAAQTTASRADVTAVIIATVENMIDGLRAGEQVDFGDLGKFRLQITSRGAETAEKFTATTSAAQSSKGRTDDSGLFKNALFRWKFRQ